MRKSVIVGIAVFSCLLLLTQYISYQRYLILQETEQQSVRRELREVKDRLVAAIGHSETSVKTLAFIVAEYGIPEQFDKVAQTILQSTPYIDALQLTQHGVITHTYPLKGNEAAMGFDILSDSVRRDEANYALNKRVLSFAGPFELKQGGVGIIGRLAIFKKNEFEGFAVVIIKLKMLLKAIGIDTTQQSAFMYQLSKTNPITQREEYILSQPFDENLGEQARITDASGDWKIMVKAKSQQGILFIIILSIIGLLLSLTGGVFAWYIVRQPERLKQLVHKKTALLFESQNQFKTTLQRVSDGFISYDCEWRYQYINAAAEKVLGLKANELIGKNIWEQFPELKNQPIYEAYHQAVAAQQYVHIELYLLHLKKWFKNHLYPSADGLSVFFRDVTEKKEKDKLIELNEARLIEAQSAANVGSWETDLATHQVIWSLQNFHIFELDPTTFKPTHTTFLDFVHPLDRDKVDRAFTESFISDDWCSIEHRIVTPGGAIKWVEERWRNFKNEQHQAYRAVGTCQDITKRKVAEIEKALLLFNTEESFILVDNNLTVVYFNDKFYKLNKEYLGFTVEKGTPILDYAQPDRKEIVKDIYASVLAGAIKESELKFPLRDGSTKVFSIIYKPARNENDEIIGAFVTTRDITERKKAELKFETEKLFSDSLINSLPGIFYLYDQDGRFTRWNKNFETISGYTAAEISLMHPVDFYDGDEKKLVQHKMEKVFEDGIIEITAHFYTKDKKKIPYYFNGYKISLNGNNYLIGIGVDISERARAEQELHAYTQEIKKLTAHLEQVREEERTRIAREVHDELGQQLTGLKMDASWLSKKISTEQIQIHEKLSGMLSLMDHTIKTIRRISSDLRPGILDDLGLVAALEWQSVEFEKQSEIRCVFKSEVGDRQFERQLSTSVFRIYQEALTNVVRHARATRVESLFQRTSTNLILTVQDNGQGFNDKEVKSKGTLGLIGMRERAGMAGAELDITSKKGTGTIITLKIPVALVNTSML